MQQKYIEHAQLMLTELETNKNKIEIFPIDDTNLYYRKQVSACPDWFTSLYKEFSFYKERKVKKPNDKKYYYGSWIDRRKVIKCLQSIINKIDCNINIFFIIWDLVESRVDNGYDFLDKTLGLVFIPPHDKFVRG